MILFFSKGYAQRFVKERMQPYMLKEIGKDELKGWLYALSNPLFSFLRARNWSNWRSVGNFTLHEALQRYTFMCILLNIWCSCCVVCKNLLSFFIGNPQEFKDNGRGKNSSGDEGINIFNNIIIYTIVFVDEQMETDVRTKSKFAAPDRDEIYHIRMPTGKTMKARTILEKQSELREKGNKIFHQYLV